MKKILYTVGLAFTLSFGAMAQQTLNGVVKDASGKPFRGEDLEGRRIPYQQHYR